MSAFDYLFPLLLILSVVRQVRGKHLTLFGLAWPVGLVIWAAITYLHGMPTAANDLILVIASAATGLVLGSLAGVFTIIYRRSDGVLMAKATAVTLVLWVLGTIGRLVFGLYALNGGGRPSPRSARRTASASRSGGPPSSSWPSARSPGGLSSSEGERSSLTTATVRCPLRSNIASPRA